MPSTINNPPKPIDVGFACMFVFTMFNIILLLEDLEYIKSISKGVSEKVSELDEAISKHLKGWKMERICKTDLAILRLAIYEILYRDDIPYKVSVNEAVELAKSFGEDSSPSFINGVLAGIVKDSAN